MFGASQNYAQHVPSNLAQPGYSYWRAMELTLRSQWYILSLMESEGDVAVQRPGLVGGFEPDSLAYFNRNMHFAGPTLFSAVGADRKLSHF